MISNGYHPDQDSTGFSPDHGWCLHCARAMRLGEVRIYLPGHIGGPFCSQTCISSYRTKPEVVLCKVQFPDRAQRDATDSSPY